MRRSFTRLSVAAFCVVGLSACVAQSSAPTAIPVFFQNASVMLGADAQDAVSHAAMIARQHPNLRIELVGYGLPTSAPLEPARLSAARAAAVRGQLINDGVSPERIQDHAGGALPAAPDTPLASRRVDISFIR